MEKKLKISVIEFFVENDVTAINIQFRIIFASGYLSLNMDLKH